MARNLLRYGSVACGEKHGKAKLTKEKVKIIRASSESSSVLALQLDVDRTTVNDVRAFRTWRHVL